MTTTLTTATMAVHSATDDTVALTTSQIARRTGLTPGTVRRHLATLVEFGEVERHVTAGFAYYRRLTKAEQDARAERAL